MTLKQAFDYCFDKWWQPVLLLVYTEMLLMLNGELHIRLLKKPLSILSDATIIILLVSCCYQLSKGRGWKGMVTLLVIVAASFLSAAETMVDGDHWADDLIIPTGIQIENPVNMQGHSYDSVWELSKTQTDLVLYNSDQPGMYEYDFWTGNIESGRIYLKAFEITQEEQLSASNIKNDTEMPIYNPSDSLVSFSSAGHFTVYEGDWGKYYAARFEVWFKPASGKPERKLFEKNFKIEGWMH